jgi:hypothetical protein
MRPLVQFETVWSRCALLAGIHAYLEKNVTGVLQPDELLRAEWMSRVSAMDLYIHELVAQSMLAIFEGRRPSTPAYDRFQISASTMQRIRAATTLPEASAAFDLHVRDQLNRVTYQAADDIADGIRLISTIELWNEIALVLGATPATKSDFAKDLKRKHSLIVRRRNIIVHEGDLKQTPIREPWPITIADLRDISNHIEQIVRTIDNLV